MEQETTIQITKLQQHKADACQRLLATYGEMVFRMVQRIVTCREDADLNERLMQRFGEQPAPATKQKRLWLYAAVAIAATIALFIVFNFGKEQTTIQEPLVAQQIEKQNPQQPTPAVSEPVEEQEPIVAEAQPAQKAMKRLRKVVVKLVELIPASEAESANDTDPFVAMAAQIEDIQQRGQCLQQEIDLLMEY